MIHSLVKSALRAEGRMGAASMAVLYGGLRSANKCRYLVLERRPDLSVDHIISHSGRFVFASIPKVATRSFLELFSRRQLSFLEPAFVQISLERLLEESPSYESYFRFSFVRNPWDRVVSCYENKICSPLSLNRLKIISRYENLFPGMPFREFVHWLSTDEGSDLHADRHWISQHMLISDQRGQILVDFVGKLEALNSDFAEVRRVIGLPDVSLQHLNRSKRTSVRFRDYYDDEMIEIIGNRYEIDIEKFGYVPY